jgi:hypothetical protein
MFGGGGGYYYKEAHIFQKSSSHLKILGAWRLTCSNFHTKDPQILVMTVQNLFNMATWWKGFVHLCTTGQLLHINNILAH